MPRDPYDPSYWRPIGGGRSPYPTYGQGPYMPQVRGRSSYPTYGQGPYMPPTAAPRQTPQPTAGGWNPGVYQRMSTWVDLMRENNQPAGWYGATSGGYTGRVYGELGGLGAYNPVTGAWEPAITATMYDPNYGNPATYSGYTFSRTRNRGGRYAWMTNLWEQRLGRELTPQERYDVMNPARFNPYTGETKVPAGKKVLGYKPKAGGKKGKKGRAGVAPGWTSAVAQFNV